MNRDKEENLGLKDQKVQLETLDHKDLRVLEVIQVLLVRKEEEVNLVVLGHKDKKESKENRVHKDRKEKREPQVTKEVLETKVLKDLKVTKDQLEWLEILVHMVALVNPEVKDQLGIQDHKVQVDFEDLLAIRDLLDQQESLETLVLLDHLDLL